jgi:hypothetical protein
VIVKKPSTRRRAKPPAVGIHFPRFRDEEQLEEVVRDRAGADIGEVVARVPGRRGDERKRAADPERVRDPVEDRRDAGVEAPEGELGPLVRATLLGERAADLRHDEHVGEDERDGEHDQPGEALPSRRRHQPERVQADERADQEEQHVEAPQRLDQLALLLQRQLRRTFDRVHVS